MRINFVDSKFNLQQLFELQKYTMETADKTVNISVFSGKFFTRAEQIADASGKKTLDNPYEILNKHFEAIGGLDKIKAEKNTYCEGVYVSGGLNGTYKKWQEGALCERTEINFGSLNLNCISSRNDQTVWRMNSLDEIHQLYIEKREKALKEKKVEELLRSYEYLKPQSKYFKVTFEGIQKIGSVDCYVVKITNNINEDIHLEYINTSNFYLEKTITKSIYSEINTIFSDYREVKGIKRAFKQEIETLPIGRKEIIKIAKYESNLKIDTSVFDPPKEVEDVQFNMDEKFENIPIQYVGNHIFITVNINGQEGLWCLDSGTNVSMIDLEYAKKLGLEPHENINVQGEGKIFQGSFIEIPQLSVQGIYLKNQKIISLNGLSKIFKEMEVEPAGILGCDFLSRFVTKVDIADRKVSFYTPYKFKYEGPGKVIYANVQNNLFYLPMILDEEYSGQWLLDLGASWTLINYPFAEKNKLQKRKGIDIIDKGESGNFDLKIVRFRTVELGGFLVNENLAAISLTRKGESGSEESAGIIGNRIVRHFVIYLDYNKQQVILEKGKDFDKVFPVDRSGLQLKLSDSGEIIVFYVSPGTPSDKAGFKKSDIITAINGADIKSFGGLMPVVDLLKEKAGTEYKFTILRNGETKQINLKLKDLF